MKIEVSKKDVIWGYFAQFFNLGSGLITLPLILKMLSAEEVGFNYILISLGSIIALFEMGFSGQFSRFLTYIFCGAQRIQKDGIADECSDTINEYLLACTIVTAKKIYKIISFIALVFLLSIGSWYIEYITDGFMSIKNVYYVWAIFCLSSFFNIYFLYLNAFLQGRGLIKEAKKAQVYSRIAQILITYIMLLMGFGLISVAIANFVSPFVFRFLTYKSFFTFHIKTIIRDNNVSKDDMKEMFIILFHNSKKMGIIGVLSTMIGYASTVIIGVFLPLSEVASFGLMAQIVGVLGTVSSTYFFIITPEICSSLVVKDYLRVKNIFGMSIFIFFLIYALGGIAVMFTPDIFQYFHFDTTLPNLTILIFYTVYKFVELLQSLYSQLLLANNDMIFFPSAVYTGLCSFSLQIILLYWGCGLYGVVLSQFVPLAVYVAWKWPIYVSDKYDIQLLRDIIKKPANEICRKYGKYI